MSPGVPEKMQISLLAVPSPMETSSAFSAALSTEETQLAAPAEEANSSADESASSSSSASLRAAPLSLDGETADVTNRTHKDIVAPMADATLP